MVVKHVREPFTKILLIVSWKRRKFLILARKEIGLSILLNNILLIWPDTPSPPSPYKKTRNCQCNIASCIHLVHVCILYSYMKLLTIKTCCKGTYVLNTYISLFLCFKLKQNQRTNWISKNWTWSKQKIRIQLCWMLCFACTSTFQNTSEYKSLCKFVALLVVNACCCGKPSKISISSISRPRKSLFFPNLVIRTVAPLVQLQFSKWNCLVWVLSVKNIWEYNKVADK